MVRRLAISAAPRVTAIAAMAAAESHLITVFQSRAVSHLDDAPQNQRYCKTSAETERTDRASLEDIA